MTTDDMDLVREYARSGSEKAFATLVSRHVHLVHSAALRQVCDAHLAEEITQTVFITLARKARTLEAATVISGWLYRTTRFVSIRALTMQRRRQNREQEAYMRSSLHENESDTWKQIEPLLEGAMARLNEKDQNAVVLRFFQDRSFKEISQSLGTTEAGAKMRVNRVLEKLRGIFGKQGLTLSAAALAGAISAHSIQAAPAGMAASATVAAIHQGAMNASTQTLIQQTLKLMAWTKLKTTLAAGAVIILAAGTVTIATQYAKARPASGSTFTFAGYATPEASVQSMLFLASQGRLEPLAAAVAPEEMERFRDIMKEKSEQEIQQGLIAWAKGMSDYRITQKDVVSPDEVHVHIHATPSPEALHDGKVVIRMKKVEGAWKQAGNL